MISKSSEGPVGKLIASSFEHVEKHLLLEQLTVSEVPQDPEGSVDLRVASDKTYDEAERLAGL